MQIFELHFNPKLKEDRIFDSFIYEPTHVNEKKLGSLYIIGELRNVLPSNTKFLDNLAQNIKKSYYQLSFNSPEKALSESLKKSNKFLADEIKKENVSWLGNLNLVLFSIKNSDLVFAKTGDIKMLMIRAGQINDIGKNLDLQEIEPYPLKVFFNIVSGRLIENDIILVLTKDIFEFFKNQNIIDKFCQTRELDKKSLKNILPSRLFSKGPGAKISGICFIAVLKRKDQLKEAISFRSKQARPNFQKTTLAAPFFKKIKDAGLSRIKYPANFLQKSSAYFSQQIKNKVNTKKLLKKTAPKNKSQIKSPFVKTFLTKGSLKKPKINLSLPNKIKVIAKNKLILIAVLLFILAVGFFIFKKTEDIKENKIKVPLNEIQEKVNLAESFLILGNKEKANDLFKEARLEILPLSEQKTLKSDILSLKNSIEENLIRLNNLEIIENPEQVPLSEYQKLSALSALPENLASFPETEFNYDLFISYFSNIYVLDQETCKIIKYSSLGESRWDLPVIWKEKDEFCSKPKSMAIDGSIWILNSDNSVVRYYSGKYKETINLNIFPITENITEIKTKINIPYLYLLEPANKRLIIIDKETKQIIKQFQSQKFDNLNNLAISKEGKIIYILNNNIVYKIEI